MIEKESKLPADKRIDFVTIVTPNFAHFAPAMLALEKGFHVVIEKPITFTIDEARQLKKKVQETGLLLCLTHTYSGYPMVREARAMVRDGIFGKIRKVYVEYPQGWFSKMSERKAMHRLPGAPILKNRVRLARWAILERMQPTLLNLYRV
jgi:predicted dehydrogenase